eukprot:2249918-Rhodomonas_salina.1
MHCIPASVQFVPARWCIVFDFCGACTVFVCCYVSLCYAQLLRGCGVRMPVASGVAILVQIHQAAVVPAQRESICTGRRFVPEVEALAEGSTGSFDGGREGGGGH